MKTLHIMFLLLFPAALLAGCVTEEYTLYLQDVNVSGPISQPPVHVTSNKKAGSLSVTPHIAINTNKGHTVAGRIDGHSPVDVSGVYRVDTLFSSDHTISFRERAGANNYSFIGNNLLWTLLDATFGVDVDYAISKHVALSFAANYSSADGIGLWGYGAGLGFFSESDKSAIRFDAGIQVQTLAYEAHTVVVTKTTPWFSSDTEERVGFYRDKGTSSPLDFYASLTFNTKYEGWSPNIFAQVAVSRQALASFKPAAPETAPISLPPFIYLPEVIVHDARGKFSSTVFVITPGVYFELSPSARLLAGAHIDIQTDITDSSPGTIILPLLELEFSL